MSSLPPSPEAIAAARYMLLHNWLRDGVAEEQVAVVIDRELVGLRQQNEDVDKAIDMLDGNTPSINWRNKRNPELLRKLCEHLEAYQRLGDSYWERW